MEATNLYLYKKGELRRRIYSLKCLLNTFNDKDVQIQPATLQVLGDLIDHIDELSEDVLDNSSHNEIKVEEPNG